MHDSKIRKRVVVTGLGVVSSLGIGKDDFWGNIVSGKSGISKIESFDTGNQMTHNGGEIKDFEPNKFINRRKMGLMGRASLLGIAASKLALKDANLDVDNLGLDFGLCVGTTGGETQEIESIDSQWAINGEDAIKIKAIRNYSFDNIPSNIANVLKIKGPVRIFTTACAAGNYSIGYGFDLIQLGKVKKMLVGGSDAFSYSSFTGFNRLGAVSPEKCQPFDKNRKGMIPGEGAGMLVLETLEDALDRKAMIYAEILGYGLSCDAQHITNPQVEGISQCILNALKESNLSLSDIDYICAHGTGTRHNDSTESKAIMNVFKDRTKDIPVSSIKSMLGHTMGAASAIEAIVCCLAIKNGKIPPTINFEIADDECPIDCVPNVARTKNLNVVLNNGFAFGGNNSCLALKKY